MTVTQVVGDLLKSDAKMIGHGVNCKGVMGSGIALPIREMYGPKMYAEYQDQCALKILRPGGIHVYDGRTHNLPILLNIASQDEPGPDARYEWLSEGLMRATLIAAAYSVNEIALPRIGCGIGGLEWIEVEAILGLVSAVCKVDIKVYSLA